MPEGTDPADLVARDGAPAFEHLLEDSLSVPEFEARRLVASADLRTAHGRDRALRSVRPLVHSAPANSATRDELVRFLADKLDVDPSYLTSQLDAPAAPVQAAREHDGASNGGAAAPAAAPNVDTLSRKERTFIAMCLAERAHGREYLERLDDDHFSSDALRSARDHLVRHFEDPLAELPDGDPMVTAIVTEAAMRGQEEQASEEALRLTFLELEYQRVQRELRHAHREGDFERQRELFPMKKSVKAQIDELMGQAQ